jgi:ABC-type polysaccharide/polyol phosphate export permease
MPASMQEMVYWFPVIHGLEIFRYGHVGDRMVPHYDIFYGVAGSVGLIVLGNAMLRTSLSQDSSD